MSDDRDAGGNEGNSGFASEWQRLAREDEGLATGAPDSETRHESGLEEKPQGQGGDAPPSEAAPQAPAPSENTDDIWANAPEPLRKAWEAERVAREKAENAVRSNNGRLSKAERDAAELRARLAAQPDRQAPPPPEKKIEVPANLQAVLDEYGEVNGPVVEELMSLRQTVARLLDSNASAEQKQAARDQLELQEFLAREEDKLSEAHQDWREVVLEPGFVQWVQGGPQAIRDGIARNGNGIVDASEAAWILDQFKRDAGRNTEDEVAARRRRQLEGSRAIPARSPGVTTGTPPDDYSSEWKRLAAEDRRREAARR